MWTSMVWLAARITTAEDARDGAGLAAGCSPAAKASPGCCSAAAHQRPLQSGFSAGHGAGTTPHLASHPTPALAPLMLRLLTVFGQDSVHVLGMP